MRTAPISPVPFGCLRLAGGSGGFGLVFLETVVPGKAVVSGNHRAIPDIIQEGVAVFPVPQRSLWRSIGKLKLLITNDTLREDMGRGDP